MKGIEVEKHKQRRREVKLCSGFGQWVCVDLGVAVRGGAWMKGGQEPTLQRWARDHEEPYVQSECVRFILQGVWSHGRVTASVV